MERDINGIMSAVYLCGNEHLMAERFGGWTGY